MYERFTERARQVIVLAQQTAKTAGRDRVDSLALTIGLWEESEGLARRVMESIGGPTLGSVLYRIYKTGYPTEMVSSSKEPSASASPPITMAVKRILEFALRESLTMGHNYIGTEHLLLAVTNHTRPGDAASRLAEIGLHGETVRIEMVRQLTPRHRRSTPKTSPPPASTPSPPQSQPNVMVALLKGFEAGVKAFMHHMEGGSGQQKAPGD